jgi:hypothetical protein
MDRAPVQSSNIRSVGYDSASRTLEVEFHTGSIYQYFGVPEAVYQTLMRAPSKGTYFHDHIRDRFSLRQVR